MLHPSWSVSVTVHHFFTINQWVLKYTPEIEKKLRKYKNPVGTSWRMDVYQKLSQEKSYP